MKNYLSLIKFSHTIFAMPFALVGFVSGSVIQGGGFDLKILLLVILCMVFARSAAMAFNRWLDKDIDSKNPRTIIREIPSGIIMADAALIFVMANCILFIVCTWFINPLCFWLSPVALLIVLGYSFTKRFTALCHLVLGLGLSLAPVGAYLAVTGSFALPPVLIGLSVLFWVAGFDIIYALQDESFDKENQLYSIPVKLGRVNSMHLSKILHFISAALLTVSMALYFQPLSLSVIVMIGMGIFFSMLVYQHSIISPRDLSRVNQAFFTTNGIASVVFGSMYILDVLL
ncbi:MAG: UbiA family prenyltransferase [Saprospiraceae bacterium]|nr:UbiA family prenyltransferase [Saprospiraceae bacterium]